MSGTRRPSRRLPVAVPLSVCSWHVRLPNGSAFGPLSDNELSSLVSQGAIPGNAYLRRDNDSVWQSASHVWHDARAAHPTASAQSRAIAAPVHSAKATEKASHSSQPQKHATPTKKQAELLGQIIAVLVVVAFIAIVILVKNAIDTNVNAKAATERAFKSLWMFRIFGIATVGIGAWFLTQFAGKRG